MLHDLINESLCTWNETSVGFASWKSRQSSSSMRTLAMKCNLETCTSCTVWDHENLMEHSSQGIFKKKEYSSKWNRTTTKKWNSSKGTLIKNGNATHQKEHSSTNEMQLIKKEHSYFKRKWNAHQKRNKTLDLHSSWLCRIRLPFLKSFWACLLRQDLDLLHLDFDHDMEP